MDELLRGRCRIARGDGEVLMGFRDGSAVRFYEVFWCCIK